MSRLLLRRFHSEDCRPQGDRIGWLDGDELYLDPKAAYAVAQRVGHALGEPLTLSEFTLRKRLPERKLLASTDHNRGYTVRRTINHSRLEVLHPPAVVFQPRDELRGSDEADE